MNKLILIVLVTAAIGLPIAADAAYVNSGYWYTDYNAGKVNYYKHTNSPLTTNKYNYRYAYSYPVYYPQYYPVYYTPRPQPVCNETYYTGRYYESSNRSPNCSGRLEDWNNRQNLPNEFLSTMYGTTYY